MDLRVQLTYVASDDAAQLLAVIAASRDPHQPASPAQAEADVEPFPAPPPLSAAPTACSKPALPTSTPTPPRATEHLLHELLNHPQHQQRLSPT